MLKGARNADFAHIMGEEYGIPVFDGYGDHGECMINGLLRGKAAEDAIQAQIVAAQEMGADDLMTSFIPGTVRYAAHWGWNGTYTNQAVLDWMYAQVNDAPYQLSE